VTWAHEAEHDLAENTPRLLQVQDARELPGALARIESGLEAP